MISSTKGLQLKGSDPLLARPLILLTPSWTVVAQLKGSDPLLDPLLFRPR